jgi:hypothetical protein
VAAAAWRRRRGGGVADRWLADHPGATGLSYGYVLFTIR